MITRSYDPAVMEKALEGFNTEPYDYAGWVENKNNIMLVDGESVGLAAYEFPGLYSCHYFFKVRGKEAYALSVAMLDKMFNEYGAKAIRGLTPVSNRKARWMNRRLGFESLGILEYAHDEPHELFYLKKEQTNGS